MIINSLTSFKVLDELRAVFSIRKLRMNVPQPSLLALIYVSQHLTPSLD